MSIRKKLLVLLLSITAIAALALTGCMGEMGAEEFLDGVGALNQSVTYYGNGGTFNGTGNLLEKTLHYMPDSYVITEFDDLRGFSVARTGFTFGGWYYVELEESGAPKKDENGQVTLTDRILDNSRKIQANEKWYVAAMWVPDVKLEIKLVTSDGGKMTTDKGVEYENGDVITTRSFLNGEAVMDTATPVRSSTHTFTQFFYDEECTQRVLSNIPQPEGEDAENPVIYAQYLQGEWEIVRTARDVGSMLNNPGGKNYWIANMSEQKVIDCSSITRTMRTGMFEAHIEGNGYTISGLSYDTTVQEAGSTYSVFGQLGENTVIKNLTFEELSVSARTARSAAIYLLGGSANGATIEGVTFRNATLKVSGASIINIPATEGGYRTDNWLCGGFDGDAAFLAAYAGLTIDGAKLIINNTEYIFGE